MKLTAVVFGVIAAVASVDAAAESTLHVRVHVHEHHGMQDDTCYIQCLPGQYCARGSTTCRAPVNSFECFNPAKSEWIAQCDPGFTCSNGKCVVGSTNETGAANDQPCYAKCDKGQYCAVGSTTCRAPVAGTTECFNPATSRWIDKCAAGFKCDQGLCVYA